MICNDPTCWPMAHDRSDHLDPRANPVLRAHLDSIEACAHPGCPARAWANGWCFSHQEEGGFGRPPTMRRSRREEVAR